MFEFTQIKINLNYFYLNFSVSIRDLPRMEEELFVFLSVLGNVY